MMAASVLVCSSCGNLRSVCSDPTIDWHPQESVCWATATRQWGVRRLQAKHAKFDPSKTDSNGEPLMSPLDGRSVWVSDLDLEALAARTHEVADPDEGQGDHPEASQPSRDSVGQQ